MRYIVGAILASWMILEALAQVITADNPRVKKTPAYIATSIFTYLIWAFAVMYLTWWSV